MSANDSSGSAGGCGSGSAWAFGAGSADAGGSEAATGSEAAVGSEAATGSEAAADSPEGVSPLTNSDAGAARASPTVGSAAISAGGSGALLRLEGRFSGVFWSVMATAILFHGHLRCGQPRHLRCGQLRLRA